MRKIIISALIIYLLLPGAAFAQTKLSVNSEIDQLKDKVASKVAQLNLVQKRGVIGKVVEISPSAFTLEDINGNQIDINVDELTTYTSDAKNSFEFSDIKKDSQLSILGLYNKDSRKILARYVDESAIPLFLRGVITDKDAKNFTVNFLAKDGTSYIVDIEDVTKTLLYDDHALTDAGFSKIPTDVNAIVVGFENPKEKGHITAGRFIVFPGTPKDPTIQIVKEEISPTTTQSK